jgi:hypothetical protein
VVIINKPKYFKNIMLVLLITILLFCSYCPSCIAKTDKDIPEINLELNIPLLHKLRKQANQRIIICFERSGWPQVFDKGIEDSPSGIAIDSQGNIIVTGYTGYIQNSTDVLDFLTVKYDSEGNEIWNVTHDSGTYDLAWGIATDSLDNIIVFGFNLTNIEDMEDLDIYLRTVKYDKNGVELWNLTHRKEINNYPGGIAVDSQNCIFISGGYGDFNAGNFSCWTLKMDSQGLELWNKSFKEDIVSIGTTIGVDSNDNAIVGGMVASLFGQGYFIVRYDSDGNKISRHRYNQGNLPNTLVLDSNDNIFLTGQSYSSQSNSSIWHSLKSDKNGNLLWSRIYDSGNHDAPYDAAFDSNGNIVVVGSSSYSIENNYEHCTIIYDKNGKEICLKRPNLRGSLGGVEIDDNDRIVIAGAIDSGNNWDYYTNIYLDVTPPSSDVIKPLARSFYILNTRLFGLPTNTIIIGKFTVIVTAENPSDVTKVEFYVNNNLKETLTSTPYEWIWTDRLFGKNTIKTMVYDDSGSIAKEELVVYKFF